MRRQWMLYLSLAAIAGCKGTDTLKPASRVPVGPAFAIADGAHAWPANPGNPDFFFLPPMVRSPRGSPNFVKGAFNGKLTPTVDICELNATTEAQVNAGAPCKRPGYAFSFTLGLREVKRGEAGDENAGEPHYSLRWKLPRPSSLFYKITVRVGAKRLGFADVETRDDEVRNVETGGFVRVEDGTLPINFRIQRNALCDRPLTGPCSSAAVDLAKGGTVTIQLPFSTGPSGVTIPAQTPASPTVTITVQTCRNLNDRVLDLPTFGSCVRVTSDPPLPEGGLVNVATVFICDLSGSVLGRVASEAQERRITLHQLDIVGEGSPVVTALPHSGGCPVGTSLGAASVGGLLRAIASGQWKAATAQASGLLGPKPLYALGFLDQGGGGDTPLFSDFQFALPAKMQKVAATDNQTAPPGTTLPVNPKVLVTDLGGQPVRGARVRFTTADGSVTPTPVVTGADGLAQTAWTLRAAPPGANFMKASGRGIAGADFSGPREGLNPFQPIQTAFDGVTIGGGVRVRTGSQTFTATGSAPHPTD